MLEMQGRITRFAVGAAHYYIIDARLKHADNLGLGGIACIVVAGYRSVHLRILQRRHGAVGTEAENRIPGRAKGIRVDQLGLQHHERQNDISASSCARQVKVMDGAPGRDGQVDMLKVHRDDYG